MDASHATSTAAKPAASGDDADAAPSPQLTVAPNPVSGKEEPFPAAAADSAPATSTTIVESGVEDEQVEKFYALLANIRAMRGMYTRRSGSGDAGTSTEDTTSDVYGGVRKRARWAEPPWRPAFRMEDFAEVPGGGASRKEDGTAATSQRRGKETTGEAADGERGDAGRKDRRVVTPTSSHSKV